MHREWCAGRSSQAATPLASVFAPNKPPIGASNCAPMESSVQLPPSVRLPRARAERPLFRRREIELAEPESDRALIKPAGHTARPLRAVWFGLVMTLAQLFVAVVLLAPEGPLSYRYSTLVQHDSYWFANIIDRGYQTHPAADHAQDDGGVERRVLPRLSGDRGGAASLGVGLSTYDALLITAQAAAWGFWTYFFLFCERWKVSPRAAVLWRGRDRCASDGVFPGRRLFGVALPDGAAGVHLLERRRKGGRAKFLAALHGIVMSATRIVGLPCRAVIRSSARSFARRLARLARCARLGSAIMLGAIALIVRRDARRRSAFSSTAISAGAAGISTCSRRKPAGRFVPTTSRSSSSRAIAGSSRRSITRRDGAR